MRRVDLVAEGHPLGLGAGRGRPALQETEPARCAMEHGHLAPPKTGADVGFASRGPNMIAETMI